jgi:hypothetical protein
MTSISALRATVAAAGQKNGTAIRIARAPLNAQLGIARIARQVAQVKFTREAELPAGCSFAATPASIAGHS